MLTRAVDFVGKRGDHTKRYFLLIAGNGDFRCAFEFSLINLNFGNGRVKLARPIDHFSTAENQAFLAETDECLYHSSIQMPRLLTFAIYIRSRYLRVASVIHRELLAAPIEGAS
jgi:hypothetical protein